MYRGVVEDQLLRYAQAEPSRRRDYQYYIRGEYEAMSDQDRAYGEEAWKADRGYYSQSIGSIFETRDMTIDDAVEFIRTNEDFTDEEKNIYETNLYRNYVDAAAIVRKRSQERARGAAEALAAD